MRTIISGPVTDDTLVSADLIAGITPSSYVTNGLWKTPGLPPHGWVDTWPIESKLGPGLGETARDYTLCQNADAAIIVGGNEHLAQVARQYGLLVYEE